LVGNCVGRRDFAAAIALFRAAVVACGEAARVVAIDAIGACAFAWMTG
jgi:hypothetical protein